MNKPRRHFAREKKKLVIKDKYCMVHLHEVLGVVKIIETDSRERLPGSRERDD